MMKHWKHKLNFKTKYTVKRKKRSVNYSHYKDLALTRAWLNISEDSIVGIGQKSPRFWGRILAQFHQILGHQTNRTIQSLANRWLNISHDVSKFCGHYNKVGRLNPSGWNDQMKVSVSSLQCYVINYY